MNVRRNLPFAVVLLGTVGVTVTLCGGLFFRPIPHVGEAEAEELERAVAGWPEGGTRRDVPSGEWPPAVRRLKPVAVRVDLEGVYLTCGTLVVEAWGLFVPRAGMEFGPRPNTDPSYEHVRGRVYRFTIRG